MKQIIFYVQKCNFINFFENIDTEILNQFIKNRLFLRINSKTFKFLETIVTKEINELNSNP